MQLNFTGLVCPMPIIKLKKFLAENKGQPIDCELLITDKGGVKDIPAFCSQVGLRCELLCSDVEIRFKITN